MMASHPEVDENQFFDTRDEITSVSDSDSDSDSGSSVDCSNPSFVNYGSNGLGDEFWTKDLESVRERRERFLKWMDFSIEDSYSSDREELGNTCVDEIKSEVRRIGDKSEAMLVVSEFKNRDLLIQPSPNCQSIEDHELIDDVDREESEVFINQTLNRLHHEHDSNEGLTVKESEIPLVLSSFDPQLLPKEEETSQVLDKTKKVKKGWLQKLSVMGRIGHKQEVDRYPNVGVNINKVRVHTNKKRMKELSSVYVGQDFQAHKGSILTMKFSPDGQYLASGGEDSVVRVWNVIEDESQTIFNIQNSDPSCLYFSLNHLSKLAPLSVDKEKTNKNTMSKKSSDSACVIFPPKVFRLLEKPVHEFHGHTDKILALSWSKNGHLISSSVDKTVRIWQVGNDDCVGVFSHNNYVTCVEFNPVDDNFFISGSIDGKVRIWEVSGCQVVDWIDIREIVSAVCYFPDGKGGIVGSFDGSCRFYDIIDNRLEKGAQICLQGKKKLPGKRITGFQFSPSDPSKVMVTSADSQVRILCGVTVVCKFKGVRSSGNQLSAFFTLDGKHIISASEDSNIYTWNYINQDNHHHRVSSKKLKKVSSCETFSSRNASTAVPWCGNSKISQTLLPSPKQSGATAVSENVGNFDENLQLPKMPVLSPPDCFSLSRGFFLESLHRGNATWPEEKLPPESPRSSMAKSEYKLLKNAYQNTFTSPHMWGHVIVTAGWDGRIRTFLNYGLPIRA